MRENYFILTGIDPNEDPAQLAQKLTKFKDEQSRNSTHASLQIKLKARQNLDHYDAIRTCLLDPVSCRAEAQQAREILLKQKREQFQLADNLIQVLGVKGFLTDNEVQTILLHLKAAKLTESEIRGRIRIPIRDHAAQPTPELPHPTLEASLAKSIEELLKVLKCASLYAFLGLPETASIDLLRSKASDIQQRERNNANKGAQIDATVDLAAKCMQIFGSEDLRQKYDHTRAEAKLRTLEPMIKIAADVASKSKLARVDEATFQQLLIRARETGAPEKDAIRFLLGRFQKLNVEVMQPASALAPTVIRCYCGLVNSYSAKVCSDCGTALRSNCPKCKKENTTEAVYCICGFPIGQRGLFERLLSDLGSLLAEGQLAKARVCLDEAEKLWPAGSDLKSPTESLRKLEEEQSKLLETLNLQLQNGQAVVARVTLLDLRQRFPGCPKLTTLERAVETSEQQFSAFTQLINEAEDMVSEGRLVKARQNVNRARELLPRAVDLAQLDDRLKQLEGECAELCASVLEASGRGQPAQAREKNAELCRRFRSYSDQKLVESRMRELNDEEQEFQRCLKDFQLQSGTGQLQEARKALQKAGKVWANAAELPPLFETLRQLEETSQELLVCLDRQMEDRQLLAARVTLDAFAGQFSGHSQLDSKRQQLEAAEKAVQRLRSQLFALPADQSQSDAAVALLQQIVSLCVDDAEASQRLGKLPPPAPGRLTARVLTGGIVECRLESPKTVQRDLRFVVVVNNQRRPESATDGRVITREYRAPAVEDQQPELGCPLYYAAFTFRGEICSASPACAIPLLLPDEITDLTPLSGDQQITLKWKLPDGARKSLVLRREGDPPAMGEGLEVETATNPLIDTKLENNVRYGYRVAAGFIDPADGRSWIWSPGKTCEATPHPEASAVRDLRLKPAGKTGLTATWTAAPYGEVEIRYVRGELPAECEEGAKLELSTVRSWGLSAVPKGPGEASLTLPEQGRWFCIPLTIADSVALVGKSRTAVWIDPVSEPSAQVLTNGGRLRILLRWTWPPGANRVCAVYHRDRFPESLREQGAGRVEIQADTYNRIGYLELEPEFEGACHVTIFALTKQGDCSAGVRLPEPLQVGKPLEIKYEIMVSRTLRRIKAVTLQLRLDRGPVKLPDLILVGRADHMPTKVDDGTQILLVRAGESVPAGLLEVPVPEEWWGKRLYCRLFVGVSAAAGLVRLIPEEKSKVSLHQ